MDNFRQLSTEDILWFPGLRNLWRSNCWGVFFKHRKIADFFMIQERCLSLWIHLPSLLVWIKMCSIQREGKQSNKNNHHVVLPLCQTRAECSTRVTSFILCVNSVSLSSSGRRGGNWGPGWSGPHGRISHPDLSSAHVCSPTMQSHCVPYSRGSQPWHYWDIGGR